MTITMSKPRLKANFRRIPGDGELSLFREAGVWITLPDPDGQLSALLDLLDGTRSVESAAAQLAGRWPALTVSDVDEGIASLDQIGLLEDATATTALSPWQEERYASNLAFFSTFAGLGRSRYEFQERLRQSRVVLLGVGGVGSTLLLNLAGLGVGNVTVLDCDTIEAKNLTRQFLYTEAEIGVPKLGRAIARAQAHNSEMQVAGVERRVTGPDDVAALLPGADLVLSAIDRPDDVQSWVNHACVAAGVPFITGGIQVARGGYYSVDPDRSGCVACWHAAAARSGNERPGANGSANAEINRAIGPAASLVGGLIALEAVRYLTGFAPPVSAAKVWLVDLITGEIGIGYEWARVLDCPVCGERVEGTESAEVAR
jgi:molybdopterin/thiamine biosynthesis adenylyltransferase